MEMKKEEQTRHMDELRNCSDRLQQENDRSRARLEEDRGNNARGSSHPAPLIKQNRGKEPILPSDSDATADDELSCDAPKPGGSLTTRQPAEYKWRSGYPTPL